MPFEVVKITRIKGKIKIVTNMVEGPGESVLELLYEASEAIEDLLEKEASEPSLPNKFKNRLKKYE